MPPKDAVGMTNRADPDQTTPWEQEEQSDKSPHCMFAWASLCKNKLENYSRNASVNVEEFSQLMFLWLSKTI